jgi:hypothetical protein
MFVVNLGGSLSVTVLPYWIKWKLVRKRYGYGLIMGIRDKRPHKACTNPSTSVLAICSANIGDE